MTEPDFTPSQVDLTPIPLVGTFKHSEAEGAATLLIRAMVEHGNKWQPILPKQIGTTMKADMEDSDSTLFAMKENPFWRADDFDSLIKEGFARFTEPELERRSPIEFTEKGLSRLREKHVLCDEPRGDGIRCQRKIDHKDDHAARVGWERGALPRLPDLWSWNARRSSYERGQRIGRNRLDRYWEVFRVGSEHWMVGYYDDSTVGECWNLNSVSEVKLAPEGAKFRTYREAVDAAEEYELNQAGPDNA